MRPTATSDTPPDLPALYNDTVAIADAYTAGEHPRVTITLRTVQGSTASLTGRVEQSGVERMCDGKRYACLLVHLDHLIEASAPEKPVADAASFTSNHVLLIVSNPADVSPGDDARCAAYLTDLQVQVPVGMLGTLAAISRIDHYTTNRTDDREGPRR